MLLPDVVGHVVGSRPPGLFSWLTSLMWALGFIGLTSYSHINAHVDRNSNHHGNRDADAHEHRQSNANADALWEANSHSDADATEPYAHVNSYSHNSHVHSDSRRFPGKVEGDFRERTFGQAHFRSLRLSPRWNLYMHGVGQRANVVTPAPWSQLVTSLRADTV